MTSQPHPGFTMGAMSTRWRRAAMVVAALLSAAAALAAPLAAGADGTIALAPGQDAKNQTPNSWFTYTMNPGDTYSSYVTASNPGATPIDAYVYSVDGETSPNSGAVPQNRQDPVLENGLWVKPAVSDLTLPAQQQVKVNFTVTVPAGASPGDHLAYICFEPKNPPKSGGTVQITTVIRTTVAVWIKVPGPATFAIKVGSAVIGGPKAHVDIKLANTGLLMGKPRLTVTLNGPDGYQRTVPPPDCDPSHQYCGRLDWILPGDGITYSFPWPDALQPGAYTIHVSVTWDGNTTPVVLDSTSTVGSPLPGTVLPGYNAPVPPAQVRTIAGISVMTVVWAVLGGVVFGLLLFALILVWRRRRARRPRRDAAVVQRLRSL